MKKYLIGLAATLLLLQACKGGGDLLVTVGGEKIRQSDLDLLTRVNPRLKARLSTPVGRQKVLENFVEQELLYQESRDRGLHRKQAVKEKVDLYEKIIVAQSLIEDELEKKIREYYDNHKDEFERVKIAHILIRTAAEESDSAKGKKKPPKRSEEAALKLAQSAYDRVSKGEEFAKVAQAVSEDDRTKKNAGDLGFVTIRDRRLERWKWLAIAEKAFAMKKDEVSEPVKSDSGYHLVKVLEEKAVQPYEEAEGAVRFRIQGDVRTSLLEGLKKKYKVAYAGLKKETEEEAAPIPSPPQPQPLEPAAEVPTTAPPQETESATP